MSAQEPTPVREGDVLWGCEAWRVHMDPPSVRMEAWRVVKVTPKTVSVVPVDAPHGIRPFRGSPGEPPGTVDMGRHMARLYPSRRLALVALYASQLRAADMHRARAARADRMAGVIAALIQEEAPDGE